VCEFRLFGGWRVCEAHEAEDGAFCLLDDTGALKYVNDLEGFGFGQQQHVTQGRRGDPAKVSGQGGRLLLR
jgi:hypothetical protein